MLKTDLPTRYAPNDGWDTKHESYIQAIFSETRGHVTFDKNKKCIR